MDNGKALYGLKVLIIGLEGIGELTARQLSRNGAIVALMDTNRRLLEEVAADCNDAPYRQNDFQDGASVAADITALLLEELIGVHAVIVAVPVLSRQEGNNGDNPGLDTRQADHIIEVAVPLLDWERYILLTVDSRGNDRPRTTTAVQKYVAKMQRLHESSNTGLKVGSVIFAKEEPDVVAMYIQTAVMERLRLTLLP